MWSVCYCLQCDLWPLTSTSTLLLQQRKKPLSFEEPWLSAVHEMCYHGQCSTGNSLYHFLSVIVCLGLQHVIRLRERERAAIICCVCVFINSLYQKTTHLSVGLGEVVLFVECVGFGKRDVSLLLSKWALSAQPRLSHFKTAAMRRKRTPLQHNTQPLNSSVCV